MVTDLDKQAMDLYLSGKAKTLKDAYAKAKAKGDDLLAVKDLFRKAGVDL